MQVLPALRIQALEDGRQRQLGQRRVIDCRIAGAWQQGAGEDGIGALAFATRSYRILSAEYAVAPESSEAPEEGGATGPESIPPASAAQARGGAAHQTGP